MLVDHSESQLFTSTEHLEKLESMALWKEKMHLEKEKKMKRKTGCIDGCEAAPLEHKKLKRKN